MLSCNLHVCITTARPVSPALMDACWFPCALSQINQTVHIYLNWRTRRTGVNEITSTNSVNAKWKKKKSWKISNFKSSVWWSKVNHYSYLQNASSWKIYSQIKRNFSFVSNFQYGIELIIEFQMNGIWQTTRMYYYRGKS